MKFLILLLSLNTALACRIKQPIVSLSGPVSYLLKDLGLSTDPNLKAVSSFHHFVKEFNGQRIAGGIYLSLKKMKELGTEPYILFADESQELRTRINFYKSKVENLDDIKFINTRSKDPFQVTEELLQLIRPYLAENCGYKIQNLRKDMIRIIGMVKNIKFPKGKSWLFYLGDKSQGNQNRTLLVNDSFNLFFKKKSSFRTYPSTLAYVSPSAKVMRKLRKNAIQIGLVESNEKEFKVKKVRKNTFNIYQEGILYPGLSQVYFVENFSKWINQL